MSPIADGTRGAGEGKATAAIIIAAIVLAMNLMFFVLPALVAVVGSSLR